MHIIVIFQFLSIFFMFVMRLVICKEPGNCIINYSYHWIIICLIEFLLDEYVTLSINSQVLHRHLPTTRTNELSMITCNEYFMKMFFKHKVSTYSNWLFLSLIPSCKNGDSRTTRKSPTQPSYNALVVDNVMRRSYVQFLRNPFLQTFGA